MSNKPTTAEVSAKLKKLADVSGWPILPDNPSNIARMREIMQRCEKEDVLAVAFAHGGWEIR